jgi:hypothetical protein
LPAFGQYPKSSLGKFDSGDHTRARLDEDYSADFKVMLPAGWPEVKDLFHNEVTLSRHGPLIDMITIDRVRIEKAFKSQGKTADPAMDPVEMGRLAVNEMKSDDADAEHKALELDGVEPAMVGGLPGFRADSHFTREFDRSVRKRMNQRLYGVISRGWLYLLNLESIEPVYYEESLPAFDEMARSIKLGQYRAAEEARKKKH